MFTNKLWVSRLQIGLVLALVAVLVGAFIPGRSVRATPGSGVTAEPIATGILSDPVAAKFKTEFGNVQASVSATTIVKYTVAPGGVFGWHQHGGPLWVLVVSGDLTFYEADDPTCSPTVYSQGTTFMDPGNHIHNARNEGSQDLVIYAVFMLPAGGVPRLDAPNPGTCPF